MRREEKRSLVALDDLELLEKEGDGDGAKCHSSGQTWMKMLSFAEREWKMGVVRGVMWAAEVYI